jgi:hypothetical protein
MPYDAARRWLVTFSDDPFSDQVDFGDRSRFDRLLPDVDTPMAAAAFSGLRARRRRRTRAARGVGLAAVVALGGAGVTAVQRADHDGPPTLAVGQSTAASVASAADFTPSLFTATSAEWRQINLTGWSSFLGDVQRVKTAECLVERGFSEADTAALRAPKAVSGGANNSQFPDVAMLQAGRFFPPSAPSDRTWTGDPARQAEFEATYDACAQLTAPLPGPGGAKSKAPTETRGLLAGIVPLQDQWGQAIAGVATNPSVMAALDGWQNCMAQGGIVTSSLDDFFGQVDTKRIDEPDDSPEVQALATLYGHCIAPVADAMDTVRTATRSRFVTEHRSEVDAVQQQMNELATELSARYGVALPEQ